MNRRMFLRGAGGVSIGLPFLEIMNPRQAKAALAPKRFVVFNTSGGTIPNAWLPPSGGETDFTLGRILSPLQPFRDKLVLLDGLDNKAAQNGPGNAHGRGQGCMLTGTELVSINGNPNALIGGGISVDQAIANVVSNNGGRPLPFRSLEFGVQDGKVGNVAGYTAYSAAKMGLPPQNDPAAMFKRIFGDNIGAGADKLRADRKSVLDTVLGNYAALKPKLGAADKAIMDAHFAAVRDVEARLTLPPPPGASTCKPPVLGTVPSFMVNDNFPAVGTAQMDLLAAALACDLTRVATIQWSRSVSPTVFRWVGASRGHHDLSHDADGVASTLDTLIKINNWFAQQMAYLLNKLATTPDVGGGKLIDNTLVIWINELAKGNTHSRSNHQILLAGGAGSAIRMGRFLRFGSVPHNNLLVSVMNAMGVPGNTFGNPNYCTGPLAGL